MRKEAQESARLTRSDKLVLGLLVWFTVFNLSMDLYWVVYARELAGQAGTNFFAHLYSFYAAADRAYFDKVTSFSLGLETFNVIFTTPVNLWLIRAILKGRTYRHGLQMALGAYMTYSVLLYFLVAHLSGYANMPEKTLPAFLLFYGSSAPWLLGHLYMVFDSWGAIKSRFLLAEQAEVVCSEEAEEKEVGA